MCQLTLNYVKYYRYILHCPLQVFEIKKVRFNDTGWYSCRVVNEHMNAETKCGYLHVMAEEPKGSTCTRLIECIP